MAEAVAYGAATLDVTGLYNNYSAAGWVSSLTVQNVDAAATDVEIAFADGAVERISNVSPGASVLLYLPNVAALPAGWQGAATVRSPTGQRLTALANAAQLAAPEGADALVTYAGAPR